MDELNSLYLQMMQLGMLVIRQAISEHDEEWAAAEIELLHNVPTLVNDFDPEQHRYFWDATRAAYIDWVASNNHRTASSRMKIYYEPIWQKMESQISSMTRQVA